MHRSSAKLTIWLVVLCGAAACAAGAQAATYDVWSCRGPAGEAVATTAWQPGGTLMGSMPLGTRSDTCASGGALEATLTSRSGAASQPYDANGYRLAVPAGSQVLRTRVWLTAATVEAETGGFGAGLALGSGAEPISAASTTFGCVPQLAACSVGTPADPLGPANAYESTTAATGMTLVARCDATAGGFSPANCQPNAADPVARVALYRSQIGFDGGAAPVVAAPTGPLVDPAGVRGPAHVEADVQDDQGGVRESALLVDGAVVSTRAGTGTCVEPYVVADPCPQQALAAFSYDPSELAPGTHEVSVRATDAAGASTTGPPASFTVLAPEPATTTTVTSRRRPSTTVTESHDLAGAAADDGDGDHDLAGAAADDGDGDHDVAGAAADDGDGDHDVAGAAADDGDGDHDLAGTAAYDDHGAPSCRAHIRGRAGGTRFASLQLERRRIRATGIVSVRGRIARREGSAAGRVRVELGQRPLGESRTPYAPSGSLLTDPDGGFELRTGSRSRELRLSSTDAEGREVADTIELVQPLEVSLLPVAAVVRNGAEVTLRGRLRGAGDAAEGTLVSVQAIVDGRWREVGSTDVEADARIAWRYRFVRSGRLADYRFRFRVPSRRGLPWATATSETIIVRVRP